MIACFLDRSCIEKKNKISFSELISSNVLSHARR